MPKLRCRYSYLNVKCNYFLRTIKVYIAGCSRVIFGLKQDLASQFLAMMFAVFFAVGKLCKIL